MRRLFHSRRGFYNNGYDFLPLTDGFVRNVGLGWEDEFTFLTDEVELAGYSDVCACGASDVMPCGKVM